MKHLITLLERTTEEVEEILALAAELKAKLKLGERPPLLANRVLTQVFEKPSLRTRNSFEAAMTHLGGGSLFLSTVDAGLNGREALCDVARVLSGYSDAVVLRTFSQQLIVDFAKYSSCPVINGLSDDLHPCQALTDIFTIRETFGTSDGIKLVFVGDGNNVARSLCVATGLLNMPFTICTPPGYEVPDDFLQIVKRHAPNCNVTQLHDPVQAVKGADVVYTDVWASMGQEADADRRKQIFSPYQVNAKLMAAAPSSCRFMHDLPAKRGLEVTDEIMDGANSIVFQQAENRMHLAKGLLCWLIGGRAALS